MKHFDVYINATAFTGTGMRACLLGNLVLFQIDKYQFFQFRSIRVN